MGFEPVFTTNKKLGRHYFSRPMLDLWIVTVLRIRDVYPGSNPFPSRIRIKEFKYFSPKKWFLSSRKYDPGCSSRIPYPDFLPIADPGSATLDCNKPFVRRFRGPRILGVPFPWQSRRLGGTANLASSPTP